jgi:hypothetical protein
VSLQGTGNKCSFGGWAVHGNRRIALARKSNFNDAQKAQLYVLHRATCVYSGEKLWIIDKGASPDFTIDWADHIFPVAKGGSSTLDNGVCASWHINKEKRDKLAVPEFLFYEGKPTDSYFKHRKILPDQITHDLERLSKLHHSDWYFNRAIFRVLLGVNYLHNGIGIRNRDDLYYAVAAFKAIDIWRKIVVREKVASLEERGLAPVNPSHDQQLLLSVRGTQTVDNIRENMRGLLPVYSEKWRLLYG